MSRIGVAVVLVWLFAMPQPAWAAARTEARTIFPLHVAERGTYLVDRSGRPFLIHGDTAWSLIAQLRREEVETYLADRKKRGFNALLVNLIEHQFATNAPANAYGERPFEGKPFGALNPAYFDHAAWVLQRAEELGFVVFLLPAYLGFNGGAEGWYAEATAAGSETLSAYGASVARRFAQFDNIVWVEGGDFNPPAKEPVRAIASGIAEVSPDTLQSVHPSSDTITSDYWSGERWLSLNTVYTYGDTHEAVLTQSSRKPARPVVMIEGRYEGEPMGDQETIRRQAYGALLAGAAGHFFGNNPIWYFNGPGLYAVPDDWRGALASPGAASMTHLRSLFEELPWWRLSPSADLSFVKTSGAAYAASTSDRSLTVAYLTAPGRVTLGRSAAPNGDISWFDPSSGRWYHSRSDRTGAEQVLEPPAERNADGDRDWVLILRFQD